MSDILLKSMHFPSLDARYIVGDDSMSVEGAAADAKATGDALETKADKTDTYTKAQVDDKVGDAKTELEEAIDDLEENKLAIDGYSELATVGNAEQLVATQHITDTEPYNFRKTGGPNDVGDRVYDTLVGGSVVWNQLVDSGATEVTVPNGHKYYANINGTKSIGASTGTAISINDSTEDNVIDLTAAVTPTIADYIYSLEQTTAGAGVAWVKKYLPEVYYGFAEPHFEHVQVSAKNTVGFNQWDEEWEKGYYNLTTGEPTDSNSNIRSKNAIPAFPNTAYYAKCPTTGYLVISYYDMEGNFIRNDQGMRNQVVTTPSNCRYIRLHLTSAYGTTYNHDICINIHGDRDGEYEPYRKRTYPIEPKVLRGIPKLDSANRLYFDGDVYESDGTVTRRYGIVDLGTLTYQYVSGDYARFSAALSGVKRSAGELEIANIICTKYTASWINGVYNHVADKIIAVHHNSDYIWIYDSDYTDAAAFKAAMSGVYLVYELAAPTTETAEPFQSPMVADPLGTEEFTDYGVEQGDRDVAVPVGHTSEYPADLRGKLQRLPSPTGTNGDYIVTEIDGKLYLKPYVPAVGLTAPTTEGEGE